eukprot:548606-Rhodomonas_salina.2
METQVLLYSPRGSPLLSRALVSLAHSRRWPGAKQCRSARAKERARCSENGPDTARTMARAKERGVADWSRAVAV